MYDTFEKIKDSILCIQVNMQETRLILSACAECGICLYTVVIFVIFFFDHVGDKVIIKQRIPNKIEMIELWRMSFYQSDLII